MSEEATTKFCPQCGSWKPATTEYFYRSNSSTDGLLRPCRTCRAANAARKYRENPDAKAAMLARGKVWRDANRDRMRGLVRAHYRRNRDRKLGQNKDREAALRLAALRHYSGETPHCMCPGGCNERELDFLSIDHIGGWGAEHRKTPGAQKISRWLAKNGYPGGFRVLCFNCNMGMGFYGLCPHEEERGKS